MFFKWIPLFLFTSLCCIAPWLLGGNLTGSRTFLLCGGLLLLLMAGLQRVLVSKQNPIAPASWFVAVAGIGIVIAQLFSSVNSQAEQSKITNDLATIEVAKRADATEGQELVAANSPLPITTYSAVTRERLVELILPLAFFFAASQLIVHRKPILVFFSSIAILGTAVALFGIVQKLSWNGKLYWTIPNSDRGVPFGPFVNKNNCGEFLLICGGAALFLFSWKLFSDSNSEDFDDPFGDHGSKRSILNWRWVRGIGTALANLQTQHLYLLAAIVAIVSGIFVSLSRGAILGCLVSLIVGGLLVIRHRWSAVIVGVILLGGAVGLAYWTGQADSIAARIETLKDVNEAAAPRTEHWKDSWQYVQEYLPSGSGLGTYRYMYPPYQERAFDHWFLHAENQYLETLGELGVAGIVLLLAMLGLQLWAGLVLLRRKNQIDRALGVACLSLLAGQAVSSFVGFGLFLPANSILMATICGVVIGRASIDTRTTEQLDWVAGPTQPTSKRPVRWLAGTILMLGLIVLIVPAIRESYAVELSYRAQNLLDRFDDEGGKEVELVDEAESLLQSSLAIRPDDHQSVFLQGTVNVFRYRLEVLSQLENNEELQFPSDWARWQATSLSVLHGRLQRIRMRQPDHFEDFKASVLKSGHLEKARSQFVVARNLCPMVPASQLRLAKMNPLFEANTDTRSRIKDCLARMPYSAQLFYEVGLISAQMGDLEEATKYWKTSLELSDKYESQIVVQARSALPMKMLFESVLPQEPYELLRIAKKYFDEPRLEVPKKLLLVHTGKVIEKADVQPPEKSFLKAEVDMMVGRPLSASRHYRSAIDSEPNSLDWRISFAECLYATKDFDNAIQQLNYYRSKTSEPNGKVARLLRLANRDRNRAQKQQLQNQTNLRKQ